MRQWGPHRLPLAHDLQAPEAHAGERAPRPIWLPQLAEPVTLLLANGEKLPGRVLERSADALVVAVVVPTGTLDKRRLRGLTLEYANPGGRVRLSGRTTLRSSDDGALVRIDAPKLIEVCEGRAHVRVMVDCPITIGATVDSEPIHTHTEDLSGGGVLLASPEPLTLGDRVHVSLSLDPAEQPIQCNAEVVRIDSWGRPALQFGELSTYDRWRLIHFTVECQSREGFRQQPDQPPAS